MRTAVDVRFLSANELRGELAYQKGPFSVFLLDHFRGLGAQERDQLRALLTRLASTSA